MPLPYLHDLKRCTAKAKSTQSRCNNPAAHGCKTCRMHGARKPETIRRGADHPQYRHGNHTLEVRSARKAAIERLHHLCDLGNKVGLFTDQVKLRGRRPKNAQAIKVRIEKLTAAQTTQSVNPTTPYNVRHFEDGHYALPMN